MSIYQPAEDSFLMVDAIRKNCNYIKEKLALDMGCGSGILSKALIECGAKKVFAVDVELEAVEHCKKIFFNEVREGKVVILKSNLFDNVYRRFDVVVFNPPYLTKGEESFDIAVHDVGVIEKFIKEVGFYLNEKGFFLLLLSDANERFKYYLSLLDKLYNCELFMEKGLFFERLFVFKCFLK